MIETMAGSGNTIGSSFEEISSIIKRVHLKRRVGVCLDTAHVYAIGLFLIFLF